MHLAMQIGKKRSLPKKTTGNIWMHLLLKYMVYREDMRQNLHVVRLHVFLWKYIVKIYSTFYKKHKIIN